MRNCKLGELVCAGKVLANGGHNLDAVRMDPADKRRLVVRASNPEEGTRCFYFGADGERDEFDAWWVHRIGDGVYEFDGPFDYDHIDLNEDGWVVDENCFEYILKSISEQLQTIHKITSK